ncbi:MAG: ribosome-associated translation inhibitor RaiA [Candidatus Berkiella sp.]
MQLNITGHHVDVTPALKSYVEDKFKKIERRFNNITNIHVTLTVETKTLQRAEATVNLARGEIHATSEHENMYAAIDALIDKIDRQVVKHKEKLNDRSDDGLV